MKTAFFAALLIGLIVLGTQEVQAQDYNPYYYPHSGMELNIKGMGKKMTRITSYMCCTISYIYRNTRLTRPAVSQPVLSSRGGPRRSFRVQR